MLRVAFVVVAGVVGAAGGCGNRPAPPPPVERKDAGASDAGNAVEVAARPLGLAELAAYGWRTRDGHAAFRLARKAEQRGDWAAVVETCRQALAADPGHLEASWLLAVGLAKLDKLDEVLAPLHHAVAGHFAKWSQPSVEHPALQGFLATPTGEAWRRRVEQDRARYAAAIGRALIVTAEGELYAVVLGGGAPASPGSAAPRTDAEGARWYQLTRTPGTVIGALAIPSANRIAYVSRNRGKGKGKRELGIGVVELGRGTSSGTVLLGTPGPIAVAYSAKQPAGIWVGAGPPHAMVWRQLDDDYRLHALPPRTPRPSGPWLDVPARTRARLHALPPNVTADWDDQSLASAIRIGTSNRVVSVPSPGLIDGNTASWSPDRAHLAFVAQLDDHCAPGAVNTAAFVADAATGGTRELERAADGIALQWLAERTLAIAGDHGVTIRSLDDGAPPIAIEGATGLMTPRERPRCAPLDSIDEPTDDADPIEPVAADEPGDAGIRDAR